MEFLSRFVSTPIYLDTNVFIYALEGYPELVTQLRELFEAIDGGRLSAVTSELTVAEVLVGPLRAGSIEQQDAYLEATRSRQGLHVAPVDREVLIESARLRASEAMRLPDGIHLATAALKGCALFITNDRRIRSTGAIEVVRLRIDPG